MSHGHGETPPASGDGSASAPLLDKSNPVYTEAQAQRLAQQAAAQAVEAERRRAGASTVPPGAVAVPVQASTSASDTPVVDAVDAVVSLPEVNCISRAVTYCFGSRNRAINTLTGAATILAFADNSVAAGVASIAMAVGTTANTAYGAWKGEITACQGIGQIALALVAGAVAGPGSIQRVNEVGAGWNFG